MSIKQLNKFILFITLFVSSNLTSQSNCLSNSVPFNDGEEVIYDIEYLMGKTWVTAGKARFIVKDSIFKNQSCYYVEEKGEP